MTAPVADPDESARRSAAVLLEHDRLAAGLGFSLVSVGPGTASMSVVITPSCCNGHGTTHGGVVFALADTAFAFAANSYGRRVVASQCSITYLRPTVPNEVLLAHATERARVGRSGIYDVSVVNADGQVVALFQGHGRSVGDLLPPEAQIPPVE